jgi:hypothetical protein
MDGFRPIREHPPFLVASCRDRANSQPLYFKALMNSCSSPASGVPILTLFFAMDYALNKMEVVYFHSFTHSWGRGGAVFRG